MFKKRVLAAVAAAVMASGASAVEVNPGQKGEFLVAPLSMVGGGWESELRLINTDTVNSVVYKIAYHEHIRSDEVLDFYVFLSPGDVWRGAAVRNADGTFGIRSTDDSALVVPNTGSAGCPAATAQAVGFTPDVIKSSRPADFTYVKVWQARAYSLGAAPVAKANILARYAADCAAGTPFTAADTTNAVAGDLTLSNAGNGNVLALPLKALANYDNLNYHTLGGATTFVNNSALSTKPAVEDAIWANDFAVPYNVTAGNQTFATVTFPTKEAFINGAGSQYFNTITTPTVALTIRDEQEQTIGITGCVVSPCPVTPANSLPNELNVVAITAGSGVNTSSQLFTNAFTRGWVNLNIQPKASTARSVANYNSFGQSGAPALVTYINWANKGSFLAGTWNYAPSTQAPAAR